MLSDYQLQIINDKDFSLVESKKLSLSQGNKRKYKLHYQNLNLHLNLWLQVKNDS